MHTSPYHKQRRGKVERNTLESLERNDRLLSRLSVVVAPNIHL